MFNKKTENKEDYVLNIDSLIEDVKSLPVHKVFIDSTRTADTVFVKDVIELLQSCVVKVEK